MPGSLSAEKLVTIETCPRKYKWTETYERLRVSPTGALYRALDAGLRTDKDPERAAENEFLALAANPGLDITGHDIYATAMHYAKLSGILSAALRSAWSKPWEPVVADGWSSACYTTGDGAVRRIALVDRWSDDRRQSEIYGWRTMGEVVMLNQPILLTAVSIGSVHDKRRHSPWTRCYRHPRNRNFRLQRKTSDEDFSQTWAKVWREDSGIPTTDWLGQMRADGCMEELVHTVSVPVPPRNEQYAAEVHRLTESVLDLPDTPPMRLAGCFGFSPCPFSCVCFGHKDPLPENYGFRPRVSSPETVASKA